MLSVKPTRETLVPALWKMLMIFSSIKRYLWGLHVADEDIPDVDGVHLMSLTFNILS